MEAKFEETAKSNCYCEFGVTDWEDGSKAFKTCLLADTKADGGKFFGIGAPKVLTNSPTSDPLSSPSPAF